jgi:hypothetical protein
VGIAPNVVILKTVPVAVDGLSLHFSARPRLSPFVAPQTSIASNLNAPDTALTSKG